MAKCATLPAASASPRPFSSPSTATGEPFGATMLMRPRAKMTGAPSVRALGGELLDALVVGGEQHLERRGLLDLLHEVARRTVGDAHFLPGLLLELRRDLVERVAQARGGGDRGAPASAALAGAAAGFSSAHADGSASEEMSAKLSSGNRNDFVNSRRIGNIGWPPLPIGSLDDR